MEYFEMLFGDSATKIVFWSILGLFIANYIIAFYKSKKDLIVVINGWLDLAFVLLPIVGFIGTLVFQKEGEHIYNAHLSELYLIACAIAIFLTFIQSIISNKQDFVYIFISFFAKLFIILISVIIIFLLFGLLLSKKDKRYKDGTKNNFKTSWLALISGIATVLIISLVKTKKLR